MGEFAFDTSGAVDWVPHPYPGCAGKTYWSDLDPFTQGYVEALLRELYLPAESYFDPDWGMLEARPVSFGFSDLAPEALAMSLRDCAKWLGSGPRGANRRQLVRGEAFWKTRQLGHLPYFPPLTPTLGDDGKVYLREADHA